MTDEKYIAIKVKQLQRKFCNINNEINKILYVSLPQSKDLEEYIEQKRILIATYKGSVRLTL